MRFIYLNSRNIYPPDRHLIDGLKESGHEVFELNKEGENASYRRLARQFRKKIAAADAIIVGYPSPLLAIFARLLTSKKIFFNAISSQYEANVVSRGTSAPYSLGALKWWLVDFLSFHLSTKVLLESEAQIEYVRKLFFIARKKLVRSFSGVNERNFYYDSSVKKKDEFTVLFRGRFLPESGILTVIEAAKKLEQGGVRFRIIGAGFMYREVNALMAKLKPRNIEMTNETLSIHALREKMLECHVSLGQLADHPRLDRTLPWKLFESLALKLPYLTGRNKGALELLKDGDTCIAVNPGDADDLAKKILELKNNPELRALIGARGFDLYTRKLTSKKLAQEVITACLQPIS